jgi:recombination protein RecR
MQFFPEPVENLIDHFARLPGIGRKTAQRLAFYVLTLSKEDAEAFADALVQAKSGVKFCRICQNLSSEEICPICSASNRDAGSICVVSDPKDVAAIERTCEFRGVYHVLHGVISPINHISPEDIKIKELLHRVSSEDITEVMMATNPDTEGETTALYISKLLRPFGVRVTRLAYGIPIGGHLEFTDEITLGRAIEGRRDI